MQIEAIYDHGRLELPWQIRLAHQRFTVLLEGRKTYKAQPSPSHVRETRGGSRAGGA